jgi:hypothetical protein
MYTKDFANVLFDETQRLRSISGNIMRARRTSARIWVRDGRIMGFVTAAAGRRAASLGRKAALEAARWTLADPLPAKLNYFCRFPNCGRHESFRVSSV